jgi:hypothetical protein
VPAILVFFAVAFGLTTRFLYRDGDHGKRQNYRTALPFSANSLIHLGKNSQVSRPD